MPTAKRREPPPTVAIVAAIEARVRPTICPTFRADGSGERLEGRISAEDFNTLVTLAGAASFVIQHAEKA